MNIYIYIYIKIYLWASRSFRILSPKMQSIATNMWKGGTIYGKQLSSKSEFTCFDFKSMYQVNFPCSRTCGVRFVNYYDRHIIKKTRISW